MGNKTKTKIKTKKTQFNIRLNEAYMLEISWKAWKIKRESMENKVEKQTKSC